MTSPANNTDASGKIVVPVTRFGDIPAEARKSSATDPVIVERPLSIEVNGSIYTFLRTPGADRELAVGFLFTEGLIMTPGDILMLAECADAADRIRVKIAGDPGDRPRRTLLITSSCGMCGMPDVDAVVAALDEIKRPIRVSVETLYAIPSGVRTLQPLFKATGGAHAAALFDIEGKIVSVREDVGRHNALDKLIGHALLRGISMTETGVFLSGRTSLEMVAKAARARLSLIAAVGAPTSAAIDAAARLGITLCGFLRAGRISVYTHAKRKERHYVSDAYCHESKRSRGHRVGKRRQSGSDR